MRCATGSLTGISSTHLRPLPNRQPGRPVRRATPRWRRPTPRACRAARLSRRAAFRLPCRSDALFLADWLEYHFDELRALAQRHTPQLHLNQLERQLADDEVGVRFVYDIDGHATRHELNDCAREACAWIETEMRDKFALPIAQERFGEHRARKGA